MVSRRDQPAILAIPAGFRASQYIVYHHSHPMFLPSLLILVQLSPCLSPLDMRLPSLLEMAAKAPKVEVVDQFGDPLFL